MAVSEDQARDDGAGGGMAERVRSHDWSKTPLGPREGWSDGLRTIVDVMLATPMVSSLAVGRDRTFLFNDAAARLYGDRQADALGCPLPQVFAHEFAVVADFYDRTFAGESLHIPAQPLDPAQTGVDEVFDAFLMPVRDAEGRVIAAYMTGVAVTDRLRAEARLRDSEQRFRGLVEGVPQFVWRADSRGAWTWASPQWTHYTGQSAERSEDRGWLDVLHPDDRDAAEAAWASAAQGGDLSMEHRIRQVETGLYRWFRTRATPRHDGAGRVVEWFGTSTDIDDLRQLQDRQRLLLGELQHRVRNILAVVRSVFSRTISVDAPLQEIADHFRGRLDSLARTQEIVTQSAAGRVDLEGLIREELLSVAVGDGPNRVIEGPDVDLRSAAAELFGLAIHELTTNALKYGALKGDGARLEIRWTVDLDADGARWLHFEWIERGIAAAPDRPRRRGFGTELIEDALPYRLDARSRIAFDDAGLRCTIDMPL